MTGRYPEVVAALRALPVDHFLVDGELVALDPSGRASFQRLQSRMGLTNRHDIERMAARVPVAGIFFDCLMLDGFDLRRLSLVERKACLRMLLPSAGPVRYGDHVSTDGQAFFAVASDAHVEGIVAKRASSAYVGGRSRDWVKIKCHRRQEFVIGGYTDPQGTRPYFGALHIGVYENGRARLRVEGRHGIRRKGARADLGGTPAARSIVVTVRREESEGTRPPLGRAAARLRGALHGVDRGWRRTPSDVSRAAERQAPGRLPARAVRDARRPRTRERRRRVRPGRRTSASCASPT